MTLKKILMYISCKNSMLCLAKFDFFKEKMIVITFFH